MRIKIAAFIIVALLIMPLAGRQIPLAPSFPDTLRHLNEELVDNWRWLAERDNPMLLKHLKQEKSYSAAIMKTSKGTSKQLLKEFTAWISQQESSAAYLEGGYNYYSKSFKNKAYSVHYRKANVPNPKEETVLDENILARGKSFFALGCYAISPDSRFLAYSTDFSGDEIYSLYIKDLQTNRTQKTSVSGISDFIWQSDNLHALITLQNSRLQVDSCYRFDTKTFSRQLLYNEADPAFDISLYYSCDKAYIFLAASSKDSSECRYIARTDLSGNPKLIAARTENHQYYPDILDETIYFQSNLQNPDYSIFSSSLQNTEIDAWQPLVKAIGQSPISSFELFDAYLVLIRRVNGLKRLQIVSRFDGETEQEIIPDSFTDISFWHNPDPHAVSFNYSLENELTPYGIYSYNFVTKSTVLYYQSPVKDGFLSQNYCSKVVQVTATDGTQIPLQLIYSKKVDKKQPQTAWLTAYGAYGDPNDPWFSSARLSLLDRGIVFAVAHIRGGGEFGQDWYDSGRLMHKMNSFTDFIACQNYLFENDISSPDKLIIEGGSAGGLLMGAVTNLAPENMKLVIADVPFVDLLTTMMDDSLPLTLQEYEEWGNPNQAEAFAYMKSYSPYDCISPVHMPNMLISAAWFDTRVGYWEALKWAQKLRANNLGNNLILFRMLQNEGHTGSNDRIKSLKSLAETYAYALQVMGL